ncbi:MAG: hypothetical protein ACKO96_29585, partial [Flammeovirgaceae bacterium]
STRESNTTDKLGIIENSSKVGQTENTVESVETSGGTKRKYHKANRLWQASRKVSRRSFSGRTRRGAQGKKANTAMKMLKKRLTKRQMIRNRYLQFLSKGLFIKKAGN